MNNTKINFIQALAKFDNAQIIDSNKLRAIKGGGDPPREIAFSTKGKKKKL